MMLKKLFFTSAAIFFFTLYFHNIIEFDQDLGRHLISGHIIWQTHQVPLVNLFSYTYPNFPFINTHWLSEVFFYLFSNQWGIVSLVYLKTAVMVAALSLTLVTAYKYSKNIAATAVAFALFAPVLLERTEIRPEIFSYLCVSIFMAFLCSMTGSNPAKGLIWRWILILPLIEIVWVNSHIYFILGPILMTILLIQKLIENFLTTKNFRITILNTKHYLLITILVCLASLINPNGLSGALYPFRVFDNYGYSIVENQNIFFLKDAIFDPNIFYFEIAAALFLLSYLVTTNYNKLPVFRLLLGSLIILPIIHIRSFPLLFLIELPIFAFNLSNLRPILSVFTRMILKKNHSFLELTLVTTVIALTLLRAWRLAGNQYYLSLDSHKRFGTGLAESGRGAVDFVLKNNLHGPLFNNFDMGSYLDFRLYPKEKVFVDGRPEAYPKEFFRNLYIPMEATAENFAAVDKIYKFNLIIVSHTDATPWAENFMQNITHNRDYTLVYLDSYAAVFVKSRTFPKVARQFAINQSSLARGLTSGQWPVTADSSSLLSLGRVTNLFGWAGESQKFFEKAYALNPHSPEALRDLGTIYSQQPATFFLGRQYLAEYQQKSNLILF